MIEEGEAQWSFVHIEAAARATVSALTVDPQICCRDDDALPLSVWLTRFASFMMLYSHNL